MDEAPAVPISGLVREDCGRAALGDLGARLGTGECVPLLLPWPERFAPVTSPAELSRGVLDLSSHDLRRAWPPSAPPVLPPPDPPLSTPRVTFSSSGEEVLLVDE